MARLRYESVLERMDAAATRVGRRFEDVTLVAVSKAKSVDDVMRVYEQGHRDFGENRAKEIVEKAAQLPSDIRWHFIGALQSNKARQVRPITHLLHSMDRSSLAAAWAKGHGHAPPALIQVNTGDEPQKSGVAPAECLELVTNVLALGLEVQGLMALPPFSPDPEDMRPHFRLLAEIRDEVCGTHPSVSELSMGMTDDFEIAIEEGASLIRVGRAIFGPRN